MANLQSTNVTGTLCVNGTALGGGKDFRFCCFTNSTSWAPPSTLVGGYGTVSSLLVGGGAGGCAQCGQSGGGGGAVCSFFHEMNSTSNCSVSIGSGGGNNSTGGSTTFAGKCASGGHTGNGHNPGKDFGAGGGAGGHAITNCPNADFWTCLGNGNAGVEGQYNTAAGQGAINMYGAGGSGGDGDSKIQKLDLLSMEGFTNTIQKIVDTSMTSL